VTAPHWVRRRFQWLCARRRSDADRANEDPEDPARERRVVGEAVAKREGEREHPLPDRRLGQHAVDEVRCGVGHASATARGTEAAALARERNDTVETAGVAVHAHEAVREHPAAQECAQLARDEARRGAVAGGRALEERPERGP
jgi:hypothetical protein